MLKPLAGGHELLLTHQELSGSGEDQRTLRSFGDRRPSGVYQLQKCQKTSPKDLRRRRNVLRIIKARAKAKPIGTDLTHKGTGSQIGAFSHVQCLQYGQDSYGIHSQGVGKDEENLSMEIIKEIHFFKTSINLEIGKIDAKLAKMTLDINELKKKDKHSAEMHKSVISKLGLLTNTCDRMESKYHFQDDEMENVSTRNINDHLRVPKDYFLAVAENTSQFATLLARSDSERKKLKEEILAQVEQIHKNYESNAHIPRHYTPLTEEKLSVKEILTPFLGENVISTKDIPKLEEWPTFPGEGE
ncbi:hypothetical protein O181_044664 [Austropuccinia psidii MF-1]|uniref:Uncharacterized protein n=1 Tax=Austropuccinia psidii MF-1 TaxID=1389203 RepID=A0A9Q3DKF8_9BASI|nr:hypothetical protein [Austropuccinia psidii MF-1]